MAKESQPVEVSETIRQLPTMARPMLAKLWEASFGQAPAPKLRPELMRPVLAFRIQELAYGGHSAEAVRQLREISRSLVSESRSPGEAYERFKSGTRIVREWKGKTYEVLISGGGYQFEGETFKSLSPIANRITGTRWSGPAFFGTKRARKA
jgi:hypothetical protein